MAPTESSCRAIFRAVAQTPHNEWPAYDSTQLYDRSSLAALREDIHTVAREWFDHDAHESLDQFVCHYPLEYVEFDPHDRYTDSTQYGIEQLVRVFLLQELRGWTHETAIVTYLQQQPSLRRDLGFTSVPDQSTLWRSWHQRFTEDLHETIEAIARTILGHADNAGISIPRQPNDQPKWETDEGSPSPDEQTIVDCASKVTEQVGKLVSPTFSLDRSKGCETHENAFWEMQTYLGLRENLAANEGARSFIHESQRDRTPLGHIHRDHLRDLSIEEIREMYRRAIRRLIDRTAETDEFHRAGIVAIDITEADPFTGNRTGHEDEIIGTKEDSDEYTYQWATVQLVGNAVPLVLDTRPVTKGESLKEIVEDLLETAQDLVLDELDIPQGTAYDYVQNLETAGLVEKTREQRPYEYDAESIALTLSADGETQTITPALIAAVARRDEDEDIDVYIERHGVDGLAVALEYAYEYVDGTVNHRIAARELDLSALEAEIILQALEPVATEYADAAA